MKSFLFDPVQQALTPEGVTAMFTDAIRGAEVTASSIRVLKEAEDSVLTWDTTFGAFDRINAAIQEAICIPQLISVTHAESAVRDAAKGAEPLVDAFVSTLLLDDAIAAVLERAAQHLQGLNPVQKKFVGEVLRDYRRNGLLLPESERITLRALNEQMTKLSQSFETNLAETTLAMTVKPEQLEGLPESFLANHPADESGMVTLTTDYPDLVPTLRYAKDRSVARELYRLSEVRAAEKNIPILKELIALRNQKAKLLGYATWADYVLEPRMAKNATTVKAFLEQLHEGLIDLRKKETDELVAMQKVVLPNEGERVSVHNVRFLDDLVSKQKFHLDTQKLSEYFEMTAVQQGILDIASQLYGLEFVRVNTPAWHPDVQVFNVMRSGEAFARVYLDLHPREGKYKHAAVFGMVETLMNPEGNRRMPIAALVCNFPKPGAAPALMSHDDVVTFFHEFGHLLHHVLSEATMASLAGTNVARDFVEVPSQLFENWAWNRETLGVFAKHFQTGEALPDEMFNAMTSARTFGVAIATERQLFLATYDHEFHVRAPGFDPEELVVELYPKFSDFVRVPDTHFPCTFGHLMGYDAAYYGYQWALAIAYDVMSRFHAEGLMNAQTAKEYRERILARGGEKEETALVESFLGRPSTIEAYLKYLGVSSR